MKENDKSIVSSVGDDVNDVKAQHSEIVMALVLLSPGEIMTVSMINSKKPGDPLHSKWWYSDDDVKKENQE